MATQEDLIARRTRVSSPRPGDGICPTDIQYEDTETASYREWAKLLSEANESADDLRIADDLLELVERTPELYAHPSKAFSILDQPYPQLKYALEWVTTKDLACERPTKRTYHYLNIGVPRPLACEYSDASKNAFPWAGLQPDQTKHLSRLILAWAFILSSRWVEILTAAGEKAAMNQSENIEKGIFWKVVLGQQWQATMIRGGKTFYAPWCTGRHSGAPDMNKVEAHPDSFYAFQLLESFCLSECITKESTAMALAMVLISPKYRAEPPPLATPEGVHCHSGVDEKYYKRLSKCLSRCITLSCCDEGIASLLCSAFFEPRVPCNLIGAHLSGIRKAIEPARNDPKVFARLMARQSPKMSALWLAAIWTGHADKLLVSALGGMPPISLPVASWTGALQSFIQADYCSISNRDGFVPRAQEFSAIYLVHPNAPIPFTPSPPFGEIAISDISLEARRHLLHDHKMMESTTYWIFEAEELHPAQEKSEIVERPILRLPPIARGPYDKSSKANRFADAIDRVSSDATLNLFAWYRDLEGGLWLEENQGKHPWIIYDSDEDDPPGDEESNPPSNGSRIRSWQEITSPNIAWAPSSTSNNLCGDCSE